MGEPIQIRTAPLEPPEEIVTPGARTGQASPVSPDLNSYFEQVLARAPRVAADDVPDKIDVTLALIGHWMKEQSRATALAAAAAAASAATAASQAKRVKPFSLKRLAATEKESKDSKEDMMYIHSAPIALSDIANAGGIDVIEKRAADVADKEWYAHANGFVFNALFKAISHIPGLNEALLPLLGETDGAFEAWEHIRNHFIQKSQWAKAEFKKEVSSFRHKAGEDMATFLQRMESIRLKAQTYGYRLSDGDCCMAVVPALERSWGEKVCTYYPEDTDFDDMDWPKVKAALLREDRDPRGCVKSSDRLPLGWVSKHGGVRVAEEALKAPKPQAAASSSTPAVPSQGQ